MWVYWKACATSEGCWAPCWEGGYSRLGAGQEDVFGGCITDIHCVLIGFAYFLWIKPWQNWRIIFWHYQKYKLYVLLFNLSILWKWRRKKWGDNNLIIFVLFLQVCHIHYHHGSTLSNHHLHRHLCSQHSPQVDEGNLDLLLTAKTQVVLFFLFLICGIDIIYCKCVHDPCKYLLTLIIITLPDVLLRPRGWKVVALSTT